VFLICNIVRLREGLETSWSGQNLRALLRAADDMEYSDVPSNY